MNQATMRPSGLDTTADATNVPPLREPNQAPRCRHVTDVDWPGHTAVLYRKRCKNKTTNPSGYCWRHD